MHTLIAVDHTVVVKLKDNVRLQLGVYKIITHEVEDSELKGSPAIDHRLPPGLLCVLGALVLSIASIYFSGNPCCSVCKS